MGTRIRDSEARTFPMHVGGSVEASRRLHGFVRTVWRFVQLLLLRVRDVLPGDVRVFLVSEVPSGRTRILRVLSIVVQVDALFVDRVALLLERTRRLLCVTKFGQRGFVMCRCLLKLH